jgi:ABC-type transport system involved in multi-copper enzyme maturation permease subunit
MVLLMSAQAPQSLGMDLAAFALQLVFQIGLLALGIGAIVLVQDAIISERQLGVTEWLLSKPVSRPAYFLSKLLANGLGVLVMLVGLQGALGYGLVSLVGGQPFAVSSYLVGIAGLAVHTLFYLALTLLLGVLTCDRMKLLGISLGSLLGGMLITRFMGVFGLLTPWSLGDTLPYAVMGTVLPVPIWATIGVTAVLAVTFVAVAIFKFQRLEF